MRKNRIVVGALIALGLSAAISEARGQATHPTREFMRLKLSYNQGIVEGIVLQKYNLVLTNAVSLRNMNFTNAFFMLKNPYYFQNITNFQTKVDKLVKAATDQNAASAKEAYAEMVSSCAACHELFRREQFPTRAR